ncbi:hypothetical protein EUTSA_v10027201mg [Eutrema salsugineum]|uniref:S-protein homolog n=1 Tax=Eutrema salsugineum TaxID=72664 RepID=V4MP78_EUTSA|nr:S-protein homolog 20 [Eutrema salsugineum]ESQ54813.1 hypothetical protein EUTSA_v10027201mg [Eutrema salsugineum]
MCGSSSFHMIFSVIFMCLLFGGLCEHISVDIINDIGPNVQLGLHCKSKNKDLGSQSLTFHQHYGFRESLNFWGTTLFFCHFQWGNQSKWFDIFVVARDLKTCEGHPCVWSIRPSGPCRLTGKETCFPWNTNQY